jgi:hypothetical protein
MISVQIDHAERGPLMKPIRLRKVDQVISFAIVSVSLQNNRRKP